MIIYPSQYPTEHTAVDRTPYTYHIAWSELDVHYYGSRYGKGVHPSDLFNPYKTSSSHVKNFIDKHGEPDIIDVRKIFDDVKKCRDYESRFIIKVKAVEKDNWLNKHPGDGKFCNNGPASEETKEKLRGRAVYKDKEGNIFKVFIDDPRVLSGEFISIHKDKFVSDETKNKLKGKSNFKDKSGNIVKCSKDDPRVISGELVGSTKGKSNYKDKDGNIIHCYTDDPRVISGELISIHKGKSPSEETKQKQRDSQKGTHWWNDSKSEIMQNTCPGEGWVRGRLKNNNFSIGWWNNGIINTRAKECPGEGWVRGKVSGNNLGKTWWNNGTINKICFDCPGDEWIEGKINFNKIKRKWYHNDSIELLSENHPGEGFVRGRFASSQKGTHWWNNEGERKMSKECPGEGWLPGSGLSGVPNS